MSLPNNEEEHNLLAQLQRDAYLRRFGGLGNTLSATSTASAGTNGLGPIVDPRSQQLSSFSNFVMGAAVATDQDALARRFASYFQAPPAREASMDPDLALELALGGRDYLTPSRSASQVSHQSVASTSGLAGLGNVSNLNSTSAGLGLSNNNEGFSNELPSNLDLFLNPSRIASIEIRDSDLLHMNRGVPPPPPSASDFPWLQNDDLLNNRVAERSISGSLQHNFNLPSSMVTPTKSDIIRQQQERIEILKKQEEALRRSTPTLSNTHSSAKTSSDYSTSIATMETEKKEASYKDVPKSETTKESLYKDSSYTANDSKPKAATSVSKSKESNESKTQSEEKNQKRFKPYHEDKWNINLEALRAFKKETGHCLVPHTFPPNPHLARWVKRQRRQFKLMMEGEEKSTMTNERIDILNAEGFVWDSHDAAWREKFAELLNYKKEFGHCRVPSCCRDHPQLATWVKCQRRQYKLLYEGKPSSMNEERRNLLNQIEFSWEVRPLNGKAGKADPASDVSKERVLHGKSVGL